MRAIIGLGEEARREMPQFPAINHSRIYDMAANWFLLPEHCCALVSEHDYIITGMLISTIAENLWSGEREALCHTLYTLPSNRNSAPYLIKAWLQWVKSINVQKAKMSLENDDPKLRRLLTILGFKEEATRFKVEFNHG